MVMINILLCLCDALSFLHYLSEQYVQITCRTKYWIVWHCMPVMCWSCDGHVTSCDNVGMVMWHHMTYWGCWRGFWQSGGRFRSVSWWPVPFGRQGCWRVPKHRTATQSTCSPHLELRIWWEKVHYCKTRERAVEDKGGRKGGRKKIRGKVVSLHLLVVLVACHGHSNHLRTFLSLYLHRHAQHCRGFII